MDKTHRPPFFSLRLCSYFLRTTVPRIPRSHPSSGRGCLQLNFWSNHRRTWTFAVLRFWKAIVSHLVMRRDHWRSVTFARVASFIHVDSSWGGHCFFTVESGWLHLSWSRIYGSQEEWLLFIIDGGDEGWRSAFPFFEGLLGTLITPYCICGIVGIICAVFFAKIYQREVIFIVKNQMWDFVHIILNGCKQTAVCAWKNVVVRRLLNSRAISLSSWSKSLISQFKEIKQERVYVEEKWYEN